MSSGILGIMDSLAPAGVRDRSPDEVIKALVTWTIHRETMAVQGVCPACTGRVSTSLVRCEDADAVDERCEVLHVALGSLVLVVLAQSRSTHAREINR